LKNAKTISTVYKNVIKWSVFNIIQMGEINYIKRKHTGGWMDS